VCSLSFVSKNDKGDEMTLTNKGRIVRNILIAIAVLFVIWAIDNAITPDICKTAEGKKTEACRQLLYP